MITRRLSSPGADFGSALDHRLFYQGPGQQEALARLHFLVQRARRLGLMLGPAGVGKTRLLRLFAAELRQAGALVGQLDLLAATVEEVLGTLVDQLVGDPDRIVNLAELWRRLGNRLVEARLEAQPVVLLFDDFDEASPDVAACVTRLAQWPHMPLTIVLAARSVAGPSAQRLLEQIDLRIDLRPWTEHDSRRFLQQLLSESHDAPLPLADQAVARLHAHSAGLPGRLFRLADLAQLAARGQGLACVDEHTIDTVHHELAIVPRRQQPA